MEEIRCEVELDGLEKGNRNMVLQTILIIIFSVIMIDGYQEE